MDTRSEKMPQRGFLGDRKDDLRFSPSTLSVEMNEGTSRQYSMMLLEEKKAP